MKSVTTSVRTAVVQKLQGNVLYNGQAVPVRGRRVNATLATPYIYVPTQYSQNDSAKNCFSTDHTINVEVVFRSETGLEQNEFEAICDQVLQILTPGDNPNMPQPVGFGLVDFEWVDDNELIDYDDTYTYLRKIMIFNVLVDE